MSEATSVDTGQVPRDRHDSRHVCQDETATVVDGRWLCNCPGGPFYMRPLVDRLRNLSPTPKRI